MKFLIAGGVKIKAAADYIGQQFNTEVIVVNEVKEIETYGSAGIRIDRALIFEAAISSDGYYIEENPLRKRTQEWINTLNENFDNYDLVCIANTHTVWQSMIEETFLMKYRAVVVFIDNNRSFQKTWLMQLAGDPMATIREKFHGDKIDKTVYVNPDEVEWSSEVERSYEMAVSSDSSQIETDDIVYNPVTGKWENVAKEVTAEAQANNGTQSAVKNGTKSEKKSGWLFGNRKLKNK